MKKQINNEITLNKTLLLLLSLSQHTKGDSPAAGRLLAAFFSSLTIKPHCAQSSSFCVEILHDDQEIHWNRWFHNLSSGFGQGKVLQGDCTQTHTALMTVLSFCWGCFVELAQPVASTLFQLVLSQESKSLGQKNTPVPAQMINCWNAHWKLLHARWVWGAWQVES